MDAERFIIRFFSSLLIIISLIALLNFIVDPYHYYRKQQAIGPFYNDDQRMNVPGFIKHDDAEIAVIGSSVNNFFSPGMTRQIFGTDALLLNIDGSTIAEQIMVAQNLLKQRKVSMHRIIWDISAVKLDEVHGELAMPKDVYPLYLYADDLLNGAYLINIHTTGMSLRNLAHTIFGGKSFGLGSSYGRSPPPAPKHELSNCQAVMSHYHQRKDNNWLEESGKLVNHNNLAQNITDIIQIVEKNPTVRFSFYFPPYSIVRHRFHRDTGMEQKFFYVRNFFAQSIAGLNNAELFDFQSEVELISDLNHYIDMTHFRPDIAHKILADIHAGQQRFTPEEIMYRSTVLKEAVSALPEELDCGFFNKY